MSRGEGYTQDYETEGCSASRTTRPRTEARRLLATADVVTTRARLVADVAEVQADPLATDARTPKVATRATRT